MGKIYLEGADNTRDLGGLKTTEGAVIKDKQLIRSNRLSRITQKDKILLETEYHLQKILDLRTPMEVEQEPDLEVAGAVFMESMVGVSREQETRKQMLHMEEFPEMSDIYKMMIKEEFCRKQISQAVREIMNTKNGAVLWHCTEGKDRCGLLSATILFLLDVSEDDVMEDYLKTNKAAITRVEKLKKKLHLAGLHREKIEKIEGYFVAKEEFLNAALKTMKEEYGSINQFMIKGLNISMQQKEDFKQKVLE